MNVQKVKNCLANLRVSTANYGYIVSPNDKDVIWWILDQVERGVLSGNPNNGNTKDVRDVVLKKEIIIDISKSIAMVRASVYIMSSNFSGANTEKNVFYNAVKHLELTVSRAELESKGVDTGTESWIKEETASKVKSLNIEDLTVED